MGRLAVLASGSGTNFQALVEALRPQGHDVVLLVCDRLGAFCLERALQLNVPHTVVNYDKKLTEQTRTRAEDAITQALETVNPDLVALAGFMRILTPRFVRRWKGRLLNLHPTLLPRHPGAHGIEESFASSDTELGVTVHWVDEGVDTGAIIVQQSFQRTDGMTLEAAEKRIHEIEHVLYPKTVLSLWGGPH